MRKPSPNRLILKAKLGHPKPLPHNLSYDTRYGSLKPPKEPGVREVISTWEEPKKPERSITMKSEVKDFCKINKIGVSVGAQTGKDINLIAKSVKTRVLENRHVLPKRSGTATDNTLTENDKRLQNIVHGCKSGETENMFEIMRHPAEDSDVCNFNCYLAQIFSELIQGIFYEYRQFNFAMIIIFVIDFIVKNSSNIYYPLILILNNI